MTVQQRGERETEREAKWHSEEGSDVVFSGETFVQEPGILGMVLWKKSDFL